MDFPPLKTNELARDGKKTMMIGLETLAVFVIHINNTNTNITVR